MLREGYKYCGSSEIMVHTKRNIKKDLFWEEELIFIATAEAYLVDGGYQDVRYESKTYEGAISGLIKIIKNTKEIY